MRVWEKAEFLHAFVTIPLQTAPRLAAEPWGQHSKDFFQKKLPRFPRNILALWNEEKTLPPLRRETPDGL